MVIAHRVLLYEHFSNPNRVLQSLYKPDIVAILFLHEYSTCQGRWHHHLGCHSLHHCGVLGEPHDYQPGTVDKLGYSYWVMCVCVECAEESLAAHFLDNFNLKPRILCPMYLMLRCWHVVCCWWWQLMYAFHTIHIWKLRCVCVCVVVLVC